MEFIIQPAAANDTDAILSLLPRLADFDVPKRRDPKHLWGGDAKMFNDWVAGNRPDVNVIVARAGDATVGVSIVSIGKELLSGEPSAHLEVLAVDKSAEGQGVAKSLMVASEELAAANGALSMTLHVFANNTRARAVYERHGFDGELIRYSKPL